MRLRTFIIGAIGVVAIAVRAIAFDYPKEALIYEGAVGTTKVKVTASAQPFSRAAHRTTELRNAGTEEKQDWRSATVDGKKAVGTDETLPKDGFPQLSALTVWFGEQRVAVPVEYLHHVFLPRLKPAAFRDGYIGTLVAFSADGKALYLSLGVGDGGGAGAYDLLIRSDGSVFNTPIQRPEP
jgi:hypothetical protein